MINCFFVKVMGELSLTSMALTRMIQTPVGSCVCPYSRGFMCLGDVKEGKMQLKKTPSPNGNLSLAKPDRTPTRPQHMAAELEGDMVIPGSWHPQSSAPPYRASPHSSVDSIFSALRPGTCAPAQRACACTPAPASHLLESHLRASQVHLLVLPKDCRGPVESHFLLKQGCLDY